MQAVDMVSSVLKIDGIARDTNDRAGAGSLTRIEMVNLLWHVMAQPIEPGAIGTSSKPNVHTSPPNRSVVNPGLINPRYGVTSSRLRRSAICNAVSDPARSPICN